MAAEPAACGPVMKYSDTERLVRRLERSAARHPGWYRVRVGCLAAVGYAYVVLVLAGITGALVVAFAMIAVQPNLAVGLIYALVVLGIGLAAAVRALRIEYDDVAGMPLARDDAPLLFDELDRIAAVLRARRPGRVVVDPRLNCSAAERPRTGGLGWYDSTLVIGLPLLECLTREQFASVLAHELAHFSRRDGAFGCWLYRVDRTWAQLLEQWRGDGHLVARAFRWFFDRFQPYFAAFSTVLRRNHEYLADQASRLVAGDQATAIGLVRELLMHRTLEEGFWHELWEQAKERPQMPKGFWPELAAVAAGEPDPERRERWFRALCTRQTQAFDSHPCLVDRIAALGIAADESLARLACAPVPVTAAMELFGDGLEALRTKFEEHYREATSGSWDDRFVWYQRTRERLDELDAKAAEAPLELEEAWEHANLTRYHRDDDAAIPRYEALIALDEKHFGANSELARICYERGDPAIAEPLRRLRLHGPRGEPQACDYESAWLDEQGRGDESAEVRRRWGEALDTIAAADAERRAKPHELTRIAGHAMDDGELDKLIAALRARPDVRAAWLVRRLVRHLPQEPSYLLLVRLADGLTSGATDTLVQELIDEPAWPQPCWRYVATIGHFAPLFDWRIQRVRGSRIV